MKKLIISVLLLLNYFAIEAQTLDSAFTGILQPIAQNGGIAPNFDFRGVFQNNLGQFAGIEAPNSNMVLVMATNGQWYELPIVSITAGSVVEGTVTDPSGQLASLPSGIAYIGQKTPNRGYILEGDILPQEIMTCIQNHNLLKLDSDIQTGGGNTGSGGNGSTTTDGNGQFSLSNDDGTWAVKRFKLGGNTSLVGEGHNYNLSGVNEYNLTADNRLVQWSFGSASYRSLGIIDIGVLSPNGHLSIVTGRGAGKTPLKAPAPGEFLSLLNNGTGESDWQDVFIRPTTNTSIYPYAMPLALNPQDGRNYTPSWNNTVVSWEEKRSTDGYKQFTFDIEKSATVTGDTSGVIVTFQNNTWTIDISNSTGVESVNLIGTDEDYNASNQIYIEIIGGKGNVSYETMRIPSFDKGDFSAKAFGLPSDTNPYSVDIDNNPQAKVVEIGAGNLSKIRMRLEGMNAFSKYSFSLGRL